ncbi:hypothetical protein BBJ28_00002264 [Nothophytophthora sp. Chile5]|nr:hypothetical protein BBJ28_00002264 [Nothophytophthora sp. Chile5]
MACNSPNQRSPPSSSSSGRLRLSSADRMEQEAETSDVDVDGHEDEDDALLERVRHLLVDLVTADDGDALPRANSQLGDAAARQQTAGTQPKHRGNNPEAEEDGATPRERLLADKLARVLLELASEQDNLRVAARAGNALLEQLREAREDSSAVHDELESSQLVNERSRREIQRLRDQSAALEAALQRVDVSDGSWPAPQQPGGPHEATTMPAVPSPSKSGGCALCGPREAELTQLGRRTDELRRRCLELELANEREQQQVRDLHEELRKLQDQRDAMQSEHRRVALDLEFVSTQLTQRSEELTSVDAARDALRRTTRRLEGENNELHTRLVDRDELLATLESSKARVGTQLQVAENRTARAQMETERATKALQQLQKQLEHAVLRQSKSDASSNGDRQAVDTEAAEKETRDMEQLLQDASREVAGLRLENKLLRRQCIADGNTEGKSTHGRRRKATWTGGSTTTTTAAEVLALGQQQQQRQEVSIEGSTCSNSSGLSSDLPPLELEAADDRDVATALEDGKRRRKVSMGSDWFEKASTSAIEAMAEDDAALLGEAEKAAAGEGAEVTSPKVTKRSVLLSRLRRMDDHCMIGGYSEANSPDVRLFGAARDTARRSTVGGASEQENPNPRARGTSLVLEDLKKAAAESPPKSPLYLGLSFIACATAASLLVRR